MRRSIILIPLLFWGITPRYQVFNNTDKKDSITKLEKDTVLFPVMEMNIKMQKEIYDKLDQRHQKAINELKRLERIEKQNKREAKELHQIEEMFNKYDNRGL